MNGGLVELLNSSQLATLYKKSYYLLSVLLQMKVTWSKSVPTAGVGYKNKQLLLIINPEFYSNLTENQQLSLVLHEALHVTYRHLDVDSSLYNDRVRLNVAQDLVINSNEEISYLKAAGLGVYAEQFGLPEHETTHYYYTNLPENVNQENPQYNNQHDHKPLPKEAEAKIQEILAKATKACETMKYRPIVQKSGFNWKKALANYVNCSDDFERKNSYKKSNRRTDSWHIPGHKKLRDKKVTVVVDTSGSMLSMLSKLVGQICEIAEAGNTEVEWFCCDTQASAATKYRKGQNIELVGGGGTLYQPGLDAANASDVIIYVGDMEHFDTLTKPKSPVIWVNVVNGTRPNADFGKFIQIK